MPAAPQRDPAAVLAPGSASGQASAAPSVAQEFLSAVDEEWEDAEPGSASSPPSAPPVADRAANDLTAQQAKLLDQVRGLQELMRENIGSTLKLSEIIRLCPPIFEGMLGDMLKDMEAAGRSYSEMLFFLQAEQVQLDLDFNHARLAETVLRLQTVLSETPPEDTSTGDATASEGG